MDVKSKSLIATLLAILTLVLAYFVVTAGWNKFSVARAQLARVELDKKNLSQTLQAVEDFLGKYESLNRQAQLVELALPTKPDSAILLANIEDLAQESGVVISFLDLSEPDASELQKISTYSLVPIDVTVTVSASFASLQVFLNRLEQNLRVMDIHFVSVQSEELGDDLDFQLRFKTYYQK